MKYALMTTAAFLLLGAGALPALATNSNVESVLQSHGDLSLFYQALHNTGVADELKEDGEYTIFAPTNTAFAEIQPHEYPCFYSAQCRDKVAAVLRNHIVDHSETLPVLAKWGDISTLGEREILVLESYKGQYTVEGHMIENIGGPTDVTLYRINGVIIDDDELDKFRAQPADAAGIEKTHTTQGSSPQGAYPVPGGSAPLEHPPSVPAE